MAFTNKNVPDMKDQEDPMIYPWMVFGQKVIQPQMMTLVNQLESQIRQSFCNQLALPPNHLNNMLGGPQKKEEP